MKTIALLAAIFTLSIAATATAHSGGTNAQGCHFDHIHGGYHCH